MAKAKKAAKKAPKKAAKKINVKRSVTPVAAAHHRPPGAFTAKHCTWLMSPQ